VHDLGLGNRGPSAIVSDMVRTNDAIHAAAPGSRVSYFRHPGGMWTQAAVNAARQLGMTSLHWDVDPRDWHEDSDADAVERRVLEGIRARDDSIVLMHSWPDSTAEALPRILDGLAADGAELVDLAALGC